MYGQNKFDSLAGGAKRVILVDNSDRADADGDLVYSIAKSECGAIFNLKSSNTAATDQAVAIKMVLPTAEVGLNYAFVITDTGDASHDITISTALSGSDIIGYVVGGLRAAAQADPQTERIAHSSLVFDLSDVATHGNIEGSFFEVICVDGIHWHLRGLGVVGSEDATGTGFEPGASAVTS